MQIDNEGFLQFTEDELTILHEACLILHQASINAGVQHVAKGACEHAYKRITHAMDRVLEQKECMI